MNTWMLWKADDSRWVALLIFPVVVATSLVIVNPTWAILGVVTVGFATVLVAIAASTRRVLQRIDAQIVANQASAELAQVLRLHLPMPPMTGWAVTPQLAALCVRETLARKPKVIVEAGSGISSLAHGYALTRLGGGRVLALDHEPHFAAKTRRDVAAHQLDDVVEVIDAPLKPYRIGEEEFTWYDLSRLPKDLAIDLLLVDGPPNSTGKLARYPALPLLREHLADGALIIVDDASRSSERNVVKRWLKEFGDALSHTYVDTPKGTSVLIYRRKCDVGAAADGAA